MRKYLLILLSAAFVVSVTGCSSPKDRDDWQQYRAKKGQDELSADVSKRDSESNH